MARRPYAGAHFAVFPAELIAPCILRASARQGAAPLRGPVSADLGAAAEVDTPGRLWRSAAARSRAGLAGWEPSCPCAPAASVPCVVLDPFLGSGTTAAVAEGLGCRSIGIELNEAYCHLAVERFRQRSLPKGDFEGSPSLAESAA